MFSFLLFSKKKKKSYKIHPEAKKDPLNPIQPPNPPPTSSSRSSRSFHSFPSRPGHNLIEDPGGLGRESITGGWGGKWNPK